MFHFLSILNINIIFLINSEFYDDIIRIINNRNVGYSITLNKVVNKIAWLTCILIKIDIKQEEVRNWTFFIAVNLIPAEKNKLTRGIKH
jgi:hypothetical protein